MPSLSVSLSLPLILSFLFLTFPLQLTHTNAEKCHPDDENALLAFKSGLTSDPDNILSQWIPGTDCCYWLGIGCDLANRRVNSFYFNVAYLSGTVSPSLSKLVFLETFALRGLKKLSGPFPEFLFKLPKLKSLNIDNCNFYGPLPEKIGSLTNLLYLSLSENKFSGSIPNNFASLKNLVSIDLSSNKFSGRIPSSITKLTSLTYLSLGSNLLRGTIPEDIRNLKNLTSLYLQRNLLSGAIPNIFTSFTALFNIDLSYNKLHGQIPPSISSLAPSLKSLQLSHNAFSGNIPSFIGNFIHLDILDLSWNHFTGAVPKSFSNIPFLSVLDLSHNYLINPLPTISSKGSDYMTVDLSYNLFQLGTIPEWITWSDYPYATKLAKCGIKMNLENWKPDFLRSYGVIDLSNNEISGSPVWLLNQTNLVSFKASGNQLKFDLGSLKNIGNRLQELDLSRNMIYGKVPKNVAAVKKLNLAHNEHLCGSPLAPCKV